MTITEIKEVICDEYCRHPFNTETQAELNEICKECPLNELEPCDDAISREDAEQMFRNIRSHLKPQDYKSAEEFNTRDLMLLNAEQMIHALPSVTQKSDNKYRKEAKRWKNKWLKLKAQKSGKWIPVSERLPEEYGEYLVTWKTNDSSTPFISVCEYETSYEYDVEKHRFNGEWLVDDYILVHSDYEVIAWMPLPKPYEPQESEEV